MIPQPFLVVFSKWKEQFTEENPTLIGCIIKIRKKNAFLSLHPLFVSSVAFRFDSLRLFSCCIYFVSALVNAHSLWLMLVTADLLFLCTMTPSDILIQIFLILCKSVMTQVRISLEWVPWHRWSNIWGHIKPGGYWGIDQGHSPHWAQCLKVGLVTVIL